MNIVGEGFPDEIIEQIDRRQKIIGSANRGNRELAYLNSRTGWVRMVSSVDVAQGGIRGLNYTGADLAKNFVLFNGTTSTITGARGGIWPGTGNFDNFAYGLGGTEFGLVPMPGILDAEIKTETRGSLKTATINVVAHNRTQFDIIDLLYMRLGYSILLEWGSSSFFYNNGTYEESNPFSLANDFLNRTLKYDTYLQTIQEKRKASCGNYDAIIGKVVNFSWSFEDDGTYKINIVLRSMGDVIESLKTNILLPGSTETTETETETTNAETTETEGPPPTPTPEEVIYAFSNAHEIGKFFYKKQQEISLQPFVQAQSDNGLSFLTDRDPAWTGYDDGLKESKYFVKQEFGGSLEGSSQYYIKLAYFLKFLETNIIPKVDNPQINLLKINNRVKSNIIYTIPRQVSCDPGVCMFDASFSNGSLKFFPGADEFAVPGTGGYKFKGNRYGYVMNIYINVVYILTLLDSLKDEKGKVSLYDLLSGICQGICDATGNVNLLEPTVNSETNEIIITDETALPDRDTLLEGLGLSKKEAVFNVRGLYYTGGVSTGGFIRNLSFTTTVSPNLSTIITVGSTANGYVLGSDSTALSRMNNGLVDRFKTTIESPQATETPATTSSLETDYKNVLTAFNTFLEEMSNGDGSEKATWNQEAIDAFKVTQAQLLEYTQAKQTQTAQKEASTEQKTGDIGSPNIGFLPFDLSITIDGLSGMKVYQKYTIDTTYLPSNYPTSLEFIIKGISHKISKNDWTTTLESFAIPKNPFGASSTIDAVAQASSGGDGGNRAASRGTNPPPISGGNTWNNINKAQKDNAIYLYNTLISYGFSDIEARAVLGVVSKESAFIPRNEYGYGGTPYARLVYIWGWLGGKNYYPASKSAELEKLARNNSEFYDLVYGVGKRNGSQGLYGNNKKGDGYKYRGRGFNQLTFKGSYEKYNKLYKDYGSKAGAIDIIANPDLVNKADGGIYKVAAHLCALYFLEAKKSYTPGKTFKSQDEATFTYMRYNAGWGSSTSGAIFLEGLAKSKKFINSLPSKIA